MIPSSPRAAAEALEKNRRLPRGSGERLVGYGALGLPFASGHVLAFRRFTASSIGPPFTSVWHRAPDGRWTFYVNIEPDRACPRYFGPALDQIIVDDIDVTWSGPRDVSVSVRGVRLEWGMRLTTTLRTRAVSGVARLLPDRFWRHERYLAPVEMAAAGAIRMARLGLHGRAPSGQRYLTVPKLLWQVDASAAVLRSEDLGPLAPLSGRTPLGGTWLPNKGLFAYGLEYVEPFDPDRHTDISAAGCVERAAG